MNQLIVVSLDEKNKNGNNKIKSIYLGDMADKLYAQLTKSGTHIDIKDMQEEDDG